MPWAGEAFIIAGLIALVLHGVWTEYRLFHLTGVLEELLGFDEEES
jgi:uncharacterized membrane protein YqjE